MKFNQYICSSLRWENFVDRDIKIGRRTIVHMKLLKENILATRAKTSIIITCWKVFVTILFVYVFHHGIFHTSVIFPLNNNNDQLEDPLPKLSYGQNPWITLGLDQPSSEEILPMFPPRKRRSINNNISAYIARIKRQIDSDYPINYLDDEMVYSMDGMNFFDENIRNERNPKDRWLFYLTPMMLKVFSDVLMFLHGSFSM